MLALLLLLFKRCKLKRIDTADATAGNLFTEGNPALSIPATTVAADWLNSLQEEVANVVEAAGLTLDQTGVTVNQLLNAINSKIANGGNQVTFAIGNNQAAPSNVTGFLYDSNDIKSVHIDYDIHRQSDTGGSEVDETGKMFLTFDSVGGVWKISQTSVFDDSGVVFSVTAGGQVQYTSTDIAGSNSEGTLRAIIRTIAN